MIRARWRVVAGWCLFSVMGFVALLVLAFLAIAAATLGAASQAQAGRVGGLVGGLILGAGGMAVQWLVLVALYRLELRPQARPGLYYLRISRDEARLFGLWIGLLAILIGLMTAGYLLLRWLDRISGLAAGLGTIAYLAFVVWLALRSSLAGPANFATGRFGLADSWRLTRGRAWALFGMVVLAVCLLLLIAAVVFILTALVQAAIGGFHSLAPVSLSDSEAFAARPGAYLFALLAELVIAPIYLVIGQAPFVAAYRALSGSPPAND